MIQVQIASQMTAQGLAGVRWVLVDATEVAPAEAAVAAPAPVAVTAPRGAGAAAAAAAAGAIVTDATPDDAHTASPWRLGLLKLLVVALGLGAALWTARLQLGPPGGAKPVPAAPRPAAAPALPLPLPTRPTATPLTPIAPHAPGAPHTASPAARPFSVDPVAPAAPAASATLPRLTATL